MNLYYYSTSTCGFYVQEIHGNNIPADAVAITNETYYTLFAQQAEGKQIISDDAGYPIAITPPIIAPTWEQIKAQRDTLLQQCDWTVLTDSPVSNQSDWISYRQSLRDIPQDFTTPEEVIWPTTPQ